MLRSLALLLPLVGGFAHAAPPLAPSLADPSGVLGPSVKARRHVALPEALTLAVPPEVTRGEPVTFEVTGLEPGARPVLVVTRAGAGEGACYKALRGCLDVVPSDLDHAVDERLPQADDAGRAAVTFPVPMDARDGSYTWQAVVVRGKRPAAVSPPVEMVVRPEPARVEAPRE